jgi:hypothetical protein
MTNQQIEALDAMTMEQRNAAYATIPQAEVSEYFRHRRTINHIEQKLNPMVEKPVSKRAKARHAMLAEADYCAETGRTGEEE